MTVIHSKLPDEFGDRMKMYESVATSQILDVSKPIMVRIDGRTFSTFTRRCEKPFDAKLSGAMRETTRWLVQETHARVGYVQSDEISLVFKATGPESSVLFDGKVQKLTSVLASMASAKFNNIFEHPNGALAVFDARVWQVPDDTEAANAILWRVFDARKNAISSACRSLYSPKQMFKCGQARMKEMIFEALGREFEDAFHEDDRHGVFYARRPHVVTVVDGAMQPVEVVRSRVEKIDMPFFGDVVNREGFIFNKETPLTKHD